MFPVYQLVGLAGAPLGSVIEAEIEAEIEIVTETGIEIVIGRRTGIADGMMISRDGRAARAAGVVDGTGVGIEIAPRREVAAAVLMCDGNGEIGVEVVKEIGIDGAIEVGTERGAAIEIGIGTVREREVAVEEADAIPEENSCDFF
jgi:hypothetical protein